jgi:hypothetical protein
MREEPLLPPVRHLGEQLNSFGGGAFGKNCGNLHLFRKRMVLIMNYSSEPKQMQPPKKASEKAKNSKKS